MNLSLGLIHSYNPTGWQYIHGGFRLTGVSNNIPGDQTTGIFSDVHPQALSAAAKRAVRFHEKQSVV
jgi:hypothetical protein